MNKGIKNFGFAELNLKHSADKKNTVDLVNRAIRMGYDSVAINIDVGNPIAIEKLVDEDEPFSKKRKVENMKPKEPLIPKPFKVDVDALDQNALQMLKNNGKQFRQFSRITLDLENQTVVHAIMKHPRLKNYDLVAVRVKDKEILNTLSTKGDFVDIITFDPADASAKDWIMNKNIPLFQAIGAEGIAFELEYSEALTDSSARRNFITNGRLLLRATRNGRNMFLSSGATSLYEIRGPYDAANLSSLLGFNSFHGIHFLRSTPMNILLRSQARKSTIKGAIHVGDLKKVPHPTKTSKNALDSLLVVEEFKKQAIGKKDDVMEVDC